MTCEEIETGELAEKYVLGQLGADDEEAYEAHYFRCTRCFDELKLLQDMQPALREMAGSRPVSIPARRVHIWIGWAAAAAILTLATGVGWWRVAHPSAGPEAAQQKAVPKPAGPSFEMLARVEPPTYTAPSLRGASAPDPRFRAAMEKYREGNFGAAIPGLLAVAEADPKAADLQFFLGICYLMDGRTDEAITHLRATTELGETVDLEMAHFYLAKALLREREAARASAELERAIALHGDLERQSKELLQQVKGLPDQR